VLAPPPGLTEEALATALQRHWDLAGPLEYQPVGWGSHHYRLGDRWFVTVDELELKRRTRGEPLDAAFDRLWRALATARGLADRGHDFAVAPVSTQDGEPVARLGERFAVALYPFVAGESFGWGEFSSVDHRRATLALVVAVHSSGTPSVAAVDDFVVPHRDELDAALSGEPVPDCGPFARPTAELIATHAPAVRALLDRYDALAARADPARAVLTHGEPHPGNTMLTPEGWRLIDWDTALVAPPERDLWLVDPGDGSMLTAYASATGVTAQPDMLDLYRARWKVNDLAIDTGRFRRPHGDGADERQSWQLLRAQVVSLQ
jgi:hypothetical protein